MYGICAKCNREFDDPVDYDEHYCMREARAMSRLELATRLYESGKMTKEMFDKVQEEER